MKPFYHSFNEDEEFFTEERCHILELLNRQDDHSQSIARARVEPGVTTAWHQLRGTCEVYLILEGEGLLEYNEEEAQVLKKGDVFRIPPDTAQRISNHQAEDLIFLCFCTPAFNDECYELLE